MEFGSLFKMLMLTMTNFLSDDPVNETIGFEDRNSIAISVPAKGNNNPVVPVFSDKKESSSEITALVPYDCDCAMPFPLGVVTESTPPLDISQSEETSKYPHVRATFAVPIQIVHRLPDAAITDLRR